ncbi:MAG: CD225/dispanin family protein [Flavobacteriales bacterium]
MENSGNGIPPKSYMVESILVTLLCCLPLGIAGIVNASKVESAFYAGNVDLANDYAAKAKKWCLFGVIGSLVGAFIYIVFFVLLGLIA